MFGATCNASLYTLDRCLISVRILLPCPVTVDTCWKHLGVQTSSLAARMATPHSVATHSQSTITLSKLLKEEDLPFPISNTASAGKSTPHSPSASTLERTRLPSQSPELNTPLPISIVVSAGTSTPHSTPQHPLCRTNSFPFGKLFAATRSVVSAGALSITSDVALVNDSA